MSVQTINTGFIGLGKMGLPMAQTLLRAGFPVTGFDVSPDALERFARSGGVPATSPTTAAEDAEFVITMLPADAHIRSAVLGPNGVAAGMRAGSILIDMSTASPSIIRELEHALRPRKVDVVDAPVGRSEKSAADGTLIILASGEHAAVERCRPLFEAMGNVHFYCGPAGLGKTVKLVNNMVFGITVAGVSEALALGVKAGADLTLLLDTIQQTSASDVVASVFKDKVLTGNLTGFRLSLENKDLNLARALAEEVGAPFILGSLTASMYGTAVGRNLGDLDSVGGFAKFFEDWGNVRLVGGAESR